jgi:hypothetical protein
MMLFKLKFIWNKFFRSNIFKKNLRVPEIINYLKIYRRSINSDIVTR